MSPQVAHEHAIENRALTKIGGKATCYLGLAATVAWLSPLIGRGEAVAIALYLLFLVVFELVWHTPAFGWRAALFILCLIGVLSTGCVVIKNSQANVAVRSPAQAAP